MEGDWEGHEHPEQKRIENLDLGSGLQGMDRADLRRSSTDRLDLGSGYSEFLRVFLYHFLPFRHSHVCLIKSYPISIQLEDFSVCQNAVGM